jgi:16S rRNA (guanine527-N7)-methyltransferase
MTTPAESSQIIVNKAITGFSLLAPDRLAAFVGEVLSWNTSLALVSRRDPAGACERLFMESLEWDRLLGLEPGMRIADVGSGAGFPGIVWALQHPDAEFVLIERRERKAAFLERIARALPAANVTVRAENVRENTDERLSGAFDLVVTMAVGDPVESAPQIEWMLRGGGRFSTTVSRDRVPAAEVGRSLHLLNVHPGEFGRYATYGAGV